MSDLEELKEAIYSYRNDALNRGEAREWISYPLTTQQARVLSESLWADFQFQYSFEVFNRIADAHVSGDPWMCLQGVRMFGVRLVPAEGESLRLQ